MYEYKKEGIDEKIENIMKLYISNIPSISFIPNIILHVYFGEKVMVVSLEDEDKTFHDLR